jgi:hypothetical protein
VLYAAATIGAGVVSYLTSDAVITVGASGGIFGLLAAEAMFVFTKRSALLPPQVRTARQRNALVNLALNAWVSFQPHVSLSAHAGGAAVGALLILVGLAPADHDTTERTHPILRALALLSALVLAAALVCGLALSGARSLLGAPRLARRAVPALSWSVEIPDMLSSAATTGDVGLLEAAFGDIETQPALIVVARVPRDFAASSEGDASELNGIESVLSAPPDQAVVDRVERTTVGDRPAVLGRYSYPSGIRLRRLVVVREGELAQIDTLVWPAFDDAWGDVGSRVAASIQPL